MTEFCGMVGWGYSTFRMLCISISRSWIRKKSGGAPAAVCGDGRRVHVVAGPVRNLWRGFTAVYAMASLGQHSSSSSVILSPECP